MNFEDTRKTLPKMTRTDTLIRYEKSGFEFAIHLCFSIFMCSTYFFVEKSYFREVVEFEKGKFDSQQHLMEESPNPLSIGACYAFRSP